MQKKLVNRGINILLVVLVAALLFVPGAKALLINGLMKVGLFSPNVNEQPKAIGTGKIAEANYGEIKFKDKAGKEVSLDELKGKVVFLNFWATWCPPCQAEMPSINKLYTAFSSNADVVFLMVDADSDLAKAAKFMDRKKYALPVHMVTTALPDVLFDGSLPTTVIFNKKGQVVFKETGAGNYGAKKVVDFIQKLAGE